MQARMKNPVMIISGAMQPALALVAAVKNGSVPAKTLELSHLRASQINGCSFCVDMGARELKKAGESDERLFAVSAWREAPYFTDAERAGKVERRFDDEQVSNGAEPEHEVGRVVVAAQSDDRVHQREDCAGDHRQFQDRQCPVLQRERVAHC